MAATQPEEPPKEAEAKPEDEAVPEVQPSEEPKAAAGAEEEVKSKEEVVIKREKVRSIDPSEGVDLAMESSGVASKPPQTVCAMFQETYQKYPNRDALFFKAEGLWKPVVFTQYYANCLGAAKSFKKVSH